MQINKSIFKSYDVRGIYPTDFNEEAAFGIGKAFARHTGSKNVVIGYDARLSSPALFKALAEGLLTAGAKVTSIGQVPTECLYFAVGNYDFDGGIMTTASHNPKEYNGFKMVIKKENFVEIIAGKDIVNKAEDGGFVPEKDIQLEEKDIWIDYINHTTGLIDLTQIKPMNIIIDASNGVGGLGILKVQDKLPIKITAMNFSPDGNFPNHAPNPLLDGSADQIKREIKEQKADFGFIFDGDADRIYVITEEGKFIKADITLTLLAKYFLKKNPGTGIAYHVTCSKSVGEFVKKWQGKPIRTKVGFINIQKGLIENDGIMGGELSGHYCFKDNFYTDSGMIAFLTLLQIISQDGRKVSEIMKELSIYIKDPEINFEVENKNEIMEKIKATYTDGQQDFLDGISVFYDNWWFNVRPSNTEPLLRLTVEADTKEMLELKREELSKFIINA